MSSRQFLAVVVLIIALLAIAGGVMYLAVPSESLPSFFPGHLAGVTAKHYNRGDAGIGIGIVLATAGFFLIRRRRSPYPR